MKHAVDLDFSQAERHDLKSENSVYRIMGSTPYFQLDLARQSFAAQSMGLLKFDLSCAGAPLQQLRVFWWGDDIQGPDRAQSLIFTGANGTVIVPLDAYPGWLRLKQVKGLRVDLETPSACQTLSIQNASLNQRVNLSE